MSVLVDTSVWIEYFRGGNDFNRLDFLIDENLVVINDLILAELVPFLKIRNQQRVIKLLHHINKLEMHIGWEQLIEFQYQCLQNGLNGVGLPDLIIVQNAIQNHCPIYSFDNHFRLIKDIVKIELFA